MWIVCVVLSAIFTVSNYLLSIKKKRTAQWAAAFAFTFALLTLLAGYRMVLDWVRQEDWTALADVVPAMFYGLIIYVVIIVIANTVAILVGKHHK